MSPCGVGSPVHLDNQPASTVATLASVKPTVSRTFSLQIRIKLNTARVCSGLWLSGPLWSSVSSVSHSGSACDCMIVNSYQPDTFPAPNLLSPAMSRFLQNPHVTYNKYICYCCVWHCIHCNHRTLIFTIVLCSDSEGIRMWPGTKDQGSGVHPADSYWLSYSHRHCWNEAWKTEGRRWPDSQSPEWTPVALRETQESRRLRGRARGTGKSNVDSGELRVQSTRLKYNEGGTGKI